MNNFLMTLVAVCLIGSIIIILVSDFLGLPYILQFGMSVVWGFYCPDVTRKILGKK